MIPEMSSKVGILRYLRKLETSDTLMQLYNAIVQPHFNYGDVIYESASITSKTRLQKLQTRPARLILGANPRQNRNTVNASQPKLSKTRTSYYQCSFKVSGLKL